VADLATEPQTTSKRLRHLPVILIVAATIVIGALVVHLVVSYPRTDDAEVFANFIGIAPQVDGPISQLNVRDNQLVKQGDLLFQIDDRPYIYALEQARSEQSALEGQISDEQRAMRSQENAVLAAKAGTLNAEASVERSAASIHEAEADVENDKADLDRANVEWTYAKNNLRRLEPLLAKQYVTADQVDQARTSEKAHAQAAHQAELQLAVAQARLLSMQAALHQANANVAQSHAQYQQSQAAVRTLDPLVAQRQGRVAAINNAEYNYNNCHVFAPFDARVTNLTISEGAYAHVGQQIFTLIDTRVWWVIANFRETQLAHIQPGMHVDVFVMSRANVHLDGVVESIGYGVTPDVNLVGSLSSQGLPNIQRTLSWVHLASRYPVRIRIQSPPQDLLRIGESAVVVVRGFPAKGKS
jgi:multidrug efflux system membrane fusion protein